MDTGTWLNIGKRSMKYIVAWTMFLDQARPIPISFLIPPEYHSQAGSTRLGEIQIDPGGCLIYPLLFRLHWVLFHSPVIGKHVRGRHTRRWSQLVHACKVEKSQTKYKKGDVWWHKEEQFQWLNTGRNHLVLLEQYCWRRLSELCGQFLLQSSKKDTSQLTQSRECCCWCHCFFSFKPSIFDTIPSKHEVKTS